MEYAGSRKKRAVAEGAKRRKAIITLADQRKKPGSSMNVVINQAELIDIAALSAAETVKAFSYFIKSFAQL